MSKQKYESEVVVGKTGSHRAAQYKRPPTMSSASSSLSIFKFKTRLSQHQGKPPSEFGLKPFFGFTVAHLIHNDLVSI